MCSNAELADLPTQDAALLYGYRVLGAQDRTCSTTAIADLPLRIGAKVHAPRTMRADVQQMHTDPVAIPGDDPWDLDRVKQIVIENDLERGRVEYKRQLDNGRQALEAISALANTFGGVVLIGVDEDRQGLDRLTGVSATERARLVSLCWDQLTPPFSPEIIPIPLGRDDLYILAVVIGTDYIRRPVMLNKGNKILIRLERENRPPDWYRLRDLYTEQSDSGDQIHLPAPDIPRLAVPAFTIRTRLLLAGSRARACQIAGPARNATLASLTQDPRAPLTGPDSALFDVASRMNARRPDVSHWQIVGRADRRQFHMHWSAGYQDEDVYSQARLHVKVTSKTSRADTLLITLDTFVWDHRGESSRKGPFISVGQLHKLMIDITATLWGLTGEAISTGILKQPLGPPALLDLTVTTMATSNPQGDPLNPHIGEFIDFGTAKLIPGNESGTITHLGPVEPVRTMLASPAAQTPLIHDWLIELGIENGYEGVEQEVARWTGLAS